MKCFIVKTKYDKRIVFVPELPLEIAPDVVIIPSYNTKKDLENE